MSIQQENHYKDRAPEETVAYIQQILKEIGIETEEILLPESSAKTYSMRINIKGTSLGSNGKGVTLSYARASAYAELMERLQNDMLTLMAKYPKHAEGFWQFPDEKPMTAAEIVRTDNAFMDYFFRCRGMQEASAEEKEQFIRKNYRVEYFLNGETERYETRPFYSVRKGTVEYLPYYLYLPFYGSNGMSAGNTPEEALVQGFSEIIERMVQERIYREKPALPDIPDEYIQKYPYIWERVQTLRKIPGIRIFMKDCSFGGKYPVAALVVVDVDSGRYGVKLGCHPDYGIAMERTITEASQGNDFEVYGKRSILDFENTNVDENWNIYNSYKFGMAPFPYEIFGKESTFPFIPVQDVSSWTNQEMLTAMIQSFLNGGYDVLIRDVSYSGFYSFHILIPGISEIMRESSMLHIRAINTKAYLIPYLNAPGSINDRIAKLLRGNLDYWSKMQLENTMKNHYCVYPDFEFPGEEFQKGWQYLAAMCCAYLGQFQQGALRMRQMVFEAEIMKAEKTDFYRAVAYYLSARGRDLSHKETMEYLEFFFSENLCKVIHGIFSDRNNIFTSQYPQNPVFQSEMTEEAKKSEYGIWLDAKEKMIQYMLKHPVFQENVKSYVGSIRHEP